MYTDAQTDMYTKATHADTKTDMYAKADMQTDVCMSNDTHTNVSANTFTYAEEISTHSKQWRARDNDRNWNIQRRHHSKLQYKSDRGDGGCHKVRFYWLDRVWDRFVYWSYGRDISNYK